MRHEGELDHAAAPRDTGRTMDVSDTREDIGNVVCRTLKPAHTCTGVSVTDAPPEVVRVERYRVLRFPLGKPRIVHEVVVVMHEY